VDGLSKVSSAAKREEAKADRKREFLRLDDRISMLHSSPAPV